MILKYKKSQNYLFDFLIYLAKQEVVLEKNKISEDQADHHKERKREETRDWSNISNIKELKKSCVTDLFLSLFKQRSGT